MAAMADANKLDLGQFMLWYSQAGTPMLACRMTYSQTSKTAKLTVKQRLAPTPGHPNKKAMHIPLKRGMLIRHQGHLYAVTDFEERRTGKQRATVHVTLRATRDGHQVDRTLVQLEPIEEVPSARRDLQYLYAGGDNWVFMDTESFEQYELTDTQLHGCQTFLKEGEAYRALFADEQPLTLEMPDVVALKVATTAPPTHAVGTQSNILKEAELENGLEVRVPLFIKNEDMIRVNTQSKAYAGKE